jgi:hypothetical protein
VDYPPPAVRFDTRISEVAKLRTDVPLVLRLQFICIAAAPVKSIAAGIRRGGPQRTSNARLKSTGQAKPQSLTIIKCLAAAAISRRRGLQISPARCSIAAPGDADTF